jgi:hypothetical protein
MERFYHKELNAVDVKSSIMLGISGRQRPIERNK